MHYALWINYLKAVHESGETVVFTWKILSLDLRLVLTKDMNNLTEDMNYMASKFESGLLPLSVVYKLLLKLCRQPESILFPIIL